MKLGNAWNIIYCELGKNKDFFFFYFMKYLWWDSGS